MDVFLPIAQVFVSPIEILLLSALVGVLSGLFGVGGGFLMTPFLIFLGVPPAYAVANEANNILATSVSGSTTHWLKNTLDYKMGFMIVIGGSIDLMLVLMLVVGSIIGVQVGQKIGEQIDSSGLKALLAILLLIVGIAIAYDTFFAEEIQKEVASIGSPDLNFFSKFIKEFSEDMPFFYGLFSILFAVILGIAAAFIRRSISKFRKKYFDKTAKQTK